MARKRISRFCICKGGADTTPVHPGFARLVDAYVVRKLKSQRCAATGSILQGYDDAAIVEGKRLADGDVPVQCAHAR